MSDWGQNPSEGERKEGPAGERRPDSPSREEADRKGESWGQGHAREVQPHADLPCLIAFHVIVLHRC